MVRNFGFQHPAVATNHLGFPDMLHNVEYFRYLVDQLFVTLRHTTSLIAPTRDRTTRRPERIVAHFFSVHIMTFLINWTRILKTAGRDRAHVLPMLVNIKIKLWTSLPVLKRGGLSRINHEFICQFRRRTLMEPDNRWQPCAHLQSSFVAKLKVSLLLVRSFSGSWLVPDRTFRSSMLCSRALCVCLHSFWAKVYCHCLHFVSSFFVFLECILCHFLLICVFNGERNRLDILVHECTEPWTTNVISLGSCLIIHV